MNGFMLELEQLIIQLKASSLLIKGVLSASQERKKKKKGKKKARMRWRRRHKDGEESQEGVQDRQSAHSVAGGIGMAYATQIESHE